MQTLKLNSDPYKPSKINTQYYDPEYGEDPYWDDDLYDKHNLHFRNDDYPSTDDEDDPGIVDNKLSRALIELRLPNSEATSQEIVKLQKQGGHQSPTSLLDETAVFHFLVEEEEP